MTVPSATPPAHAALRRAAAAGGLAVALAVALVACASRVDGSPTAAAGGAAPTTSAESGPTTTTTQPTTPPAPPAGGGGGGAGATTQPFGGRFVYDDGLEVTVAPGVPFTPSETAAGAGAPAHLAFEVTLRNGSDQPYDDYFLATVQSGSVEGEQVFDAAQDIGGPPATVLLPEREQKFTIVFGVTDPADVVMEVLPGFDYDPVVFTTP